MAFIIVYLILAVVCAVIGSEMAKSRNRDAAAWALVCALLPLLGIIALAVAGSANAQAPYAPTTRNEQPLQFSPVELEVESKKYDEGKWLALLDVDDDIADAVKAIEGYGGSYIDEFAEKYLALADKNYLQPLKAKIIAKAMKDHESKMARKKQDELARDDEANTIYFEYLEKLKRNYGIDPDYHSKVLSVERYSGAAKAFRNGVEVQFEDGTFALKGGFLMRRFNTRAELDQWK
ncbi:hypothetical protein GOD78_28090 [Sinorhizobium medicae]|nr:hypothetical protein [Sinorhizobium medicae]MDX0821282.1 hypothetical protein [Sinorhizobium medicae]MDX0864288.1 hypothetical protein [Sinorhizobium medicae]